MAGAQLSEVQLIPSSQPSTAAPLQVPLLQVSPSEQALPSSQGKVLAVWAQPVLELQLSAVQRFWSSQLRLGPLTQRPAEHASLRVQALPSSQADGAGTCMQPTVGSHESTVQGLSSPHGAVLPPQLPWLHASTTVQGLPSSQAEKLGV